MMPKMKVGIRMKFPLMTRVLPSMNFTLKPLMMRVGVMAELYTMTRVLPSMNFKLKPLLMRGWGSWPSSTR